jgi:hypothetical protein
MDDKREKTLTAWMLIGGTFASVLLPSSAIIMWPGRLGITIGIAAALASSVLVVAAFILNSSSMDEKQQIHRRNVWLLTIVMSIVFTVFPIWAAFVWGNTDPILLLVPPGIAFTLLCVLHLLAWLVSRRELPRGE